ncbi:MAG: Omp28-related outer membrane protein [Bacteroidetes bacterium]|nr:Omp28-related outer membrane protein [Bacteroidota bacterium]
MKIKIQLYLLLAALPSLAFYACEETGADYLFQKPKSAGGFEISKRPDSTAEKQLKGILIEDFTGYNCQNCPKAADELHRIDSVFEGRIVPVAIHAEPQNFTDPSTKDKSKYDLRSEDSKAIYNLVQVDGQLPKGAVDRKIFDFYAPGVLHMPYLSWNQAVEERIAETSPCNINFKLVERTNDSLKFTITVFYHESVNEPQYLTVYVLENGIEDYQLDGRDWVSNYSFEHVLRYVPTNITGDVLEQTIAKGDVFKKTFSIPVAKGVDGETYKTSWKAEKLSVAAFVTHAGGLEVVHAAQSKLKE